MRRIAVAAPVRLGARACRARGRYASNASGRDLGYRRGLYWQAGVQHDRVVDVEGEMLMVFRREVSARA